MEIAKLTDDIHCMSGPFFVFYVLKGNDAAGLIELGISQLTPQATHDMRTSLGVERPDALIAAHGHFDHAGAASRWKRDFPEAQLMGAEAAAKALADPAELGGYLRSMQSAGSNPFFKQIYPLAEDEAFIEPVSFDRILKDGDAIDLGGIVLNVMETPGHSDCSLSLYHEKSGTVFVSDACGLPLISGRIWPTAFTNKEQYAESLKKLLALGAENLCGGHLPPIKGAERTRRFLEKNIDAADSYFEKVGKLIEEHDGDKNKIVEALNADYARDSVPVIAWVVSYGNKTMVKQALNERK